MDSFDRYLRDLPWTIYAVVILVLLVLIIGIIVDAFMAGAF